MAAAAAKAKVKAKKHATDKIVVAVRVRPMNNRELKEEKKKLVRPLAPPLLTTKMRENGRGGRAV